MRLQSKLKDESSIRSSQEAFGTEDQQKREGESKQLPASRPLKQSQRVNAVYLLCIVSESHEATATECFQRYNPGVWLPNNYTRPAIAYSTKMGIK